MALFTSTRAQHLGLCWWIISSWECRGHCHQSASVAALYGGNHFQWLFSFFFKSMYTLNGEHYLTIPRTETQYDICLLLGSGSFIKRKRKPWGPFAGKELQKRPGSHGNAPESTIGTCEGCAPKKPLCLASASKFAFGIVRCTLGECWPWFSTAL